MLVGGAAASWPVVARAQQAGPVRRIGILMGSYESGDPNANSELKAFREALAAAGWREGSNLRIEYRWGGGNLARTRSEADELGKSDLDVIITRASIATAAVLRNTSTTPVIFVQVADPVGQGFVKSFANPGTNATGFTNLEDSMPTKWLELAKTLLPELKHVTMLYNSETTVEAGRFWIRPFETAAVSAGINARAMSVGSLQDIEAAILETASNINGALITAPGSFLASQHFNIIQMAARHRLPALYPFTYWVRAGGLMSYGIDTSDLFRRAASYVDRILRGEHPGDLPVQQPTKFELVINLKMAKALGLAVPDRLMALADEVIE
jgi:putative ABC transport system substrate-binding protein